MPALLTAEFLKLRTVRSPWLLLLAAQLLVVAGISGFVVSNGGTLHETQQNSALAHVGLTSVITLIFGILAVASEYRHQTITDTYLSTPRRDRVIQAKATAMAPARLRINAPRPTPIAANAAFHAIEPPIVCHIPASDQEKDVPLLAHQAAAVTSPAALATTPLRPPTRTKTTSLAWITRSRRGVLR